MASTYIDTRTPAECRYDALKDGSAYFPQQPAADATETPTADIDALVTAELEAIWAQLYAGQEVPDLRAALAEVDDLDRPGAASLIRENVAHRLAGDLYAIGVSPAVPGYGGNSPARLCDAPSFTTNADGALFARLGGDDGEAAIYNPPQPVREIAHIHTFGLVVVTTTDELFIMTEAEYTDQGGRAYEDAKRNAELPMEDRAFAGIIGDMMDRVDVPYRAMAQAGLVLLAAAVDGVGPALKDGASEEETQQEIAARIYHAAYKQGEREGEDRAMESIIAMFHARAGRLSSTSPTGDARIDVKYTYRAPNGDLADEPIGPIACTDFTLGDGLTKTRIGTYGGEKPGIALIIGGNGINEMFGEIITLADLRQLRDNLSALLSDPRVLAACAEEETSTPQRKAA